MGNFETKWQYLFQKFSRTRQNRKSIHLSTSKLMQSWQRMQKQGIKIATNSTVKRKYCPVRLQSASEVAGMPLQKGLH